MPRSPHGTLPHFPYSASLAPSRERKRRRQRAAFLFSLATLSCALLVFLSVRRDSGETAVKTVRRGGQEKSSTAAAVETAARVSSSSSSSYLSPAQHALIRSAQPQTRDTSADGSGFRLLRVAVARREALERELEKRKETEKSESNNNRSSSSSATSSPPASDPAYVAACVVLRDQGDDLPEFIAWHAALGIKTFYLFDDRSAVPLTPDVALRGIVSSTGSDDSTSSSSNPNSSFSWASRAGVSVFVKRLSAEQIKSHPSKRAQMASYDDCVLSCSKALRNGRKQRRHSWLAFLDVDEFIVLSERVLSSAGEENKKSIIPSLPSLLSEFERLDAAALLLHWRVFGSSGRVSSKPHALTTPEAFTSCLSAEDDYNSHVKTIASTKFLDVAEPCLGPHHFSFWDLSKAADLVEAKMKEEIDGEDDDVDRKKQIITEAVGIGVEGKKAWLLPSSLPSPRFAVDVEGRRLDGAVREKVKDNNSTPPYPFYPAFLAHYAIKSRQEYAQKIARGSAMGNRKTWEFFDSVDARSSEECFDAKELSQRMRKKGLLLASDNNDSDSSSSSSSSDWFLRQRR